MVAALLADAVDGLGHADIFCTQGDLLGDLFRDVLGWVAQTGLFFDDEIQAAELAGLGFPEFEVEEVQGLFE